VPWIAAEFGWAVAEVGRQPWVVNGILPTFMGSSSVSVSQVHFSLWGFFVFYTTLFIVEIYLMFKYARLGPSSLHTGQYHFEKAPSAHGVK
ncbi:MAG: cytochrome ubiquinol oxidase subunit I, partial [Gammaproteobacteria bacterium]|nr:cytochrome ubiquinol oxidase subunit I [Gammaproteobacteria bacterium]